MGFKELYDKMSKWEGCDVSYPFEYDNTDLDYFDYVITKMEQYDKLVHELSSIDIDSLNHCLDNIAVKSLSKPLDILKDIESVNNMVFEVLSLLYKGHIPWAYEKIESFLNADNMHYANLLPLYTMYVGGNMYRIRCEKGVKLSQKELFHVPFNKRYLVASQRYSISGVPALYLGDSIKACFYEGRCPDFSTICFSKFSLVDEMTFLDFSFPATGVELELFEYYSFFTFFSLQVACSVRTRKYDGQKYIPEYAFPQLMLLWVKDHGRNNIKGIRYLSTRLNNSSEFENRNLLYNYVIPTTGADAKKGYCKELQELFTMSLPTYFPADLIKDCNGIITNEMMAFAQRQQCRDIQLDTDE